MKIMNTTSKVIAATLAGVATGIAIGLLFAPDKGTETRRKLSEGCSDLSDTLRDKISDLVGTAKEEFNYARDKASDLARRATGKAQSMKAEAQDSFNA